MYRKLHVVVLIVILSSLLWPATPTFAEDTETGKDRRTDGVTLSFETADQYTHLFTGSASYSIAIEVPPGPGGFAPSLALQYSSDAGNGWLGLGWDIAGLDRIERSTRYGIPTYSDLPCAEFSYQTARFDLYLHGQYYQILRDLTSNQYITDPFEDFKISCSCENNAISEWTIVDKSGITYTFKGIPAVGRSGYHSYPIDHTVDRNGNKIGYEYYVDKQDGDYYPKTITYGAFPGLLSVNFELEKRNKLPGVNEFEKFSDYKSGSKMIMDQRIRYIVIRSTAQHPETPLVAYPPIPAGVVRVYSLKYIPTHQGYQSLLSEVRIQGLSGDYLAYKFTYQGQQPSEEGFEQIIHETVREETSVDVPNLWPLKSDLYPGVRWVDVNGDVLPDMVWGLENQYWEWGAGRVGKKAIAQRPLEWVPIGLPHGYNLLFNKKAEWCDTPPTTSISEQIRGYCYDILGFPAPIAIWPDIGPTHWSYRSEFAGTELIDVNNDGFVDIIHALESPGLNEPSLTWINDKGRGWRVDPAWSLPLALAVFEYPYTVINEMKIVDVNGDGFPDIVTTDKGTFLNKGAYGLKGWWENPDSMWKTPVESFGFVEGDRYVDFGVRYVDLNGDGLNDVLVNRNPGVVYPIDSDETIQNEAWINTGHLQKNGTVYEKQDQWRVPVNIYDPDMFTTGQNYRGSNLGTQILDINLDGLPDLVYSLKDVEGTTDQAVVFNTGTGWGPILRGGWVDKLPNFAAGWGRGPFGFFQDNGVSFADFNGDGAPDIGQSQQSFTWNRETAQLDFQAREIGIWYNKFKPPLLVKVETLYGATIEYHYRSSHGDGGFARHQDEYGIHRLPFPKQVVASVELNDGVRNQVLTGFTYAGGLFDFQSREFRGFRSVTVLPGGGNLKYPPPAQMVYSFYQDDARKGQIASIWTGNTSVYSEKVNHYALARVGADARGSVYQPLLGTTYDLTYDSVNAYQDLIFDLNFDAPGKISFDPWMGLSPAKASMQGVSWTQNQSIGRYSLVFEQDDDCVVVPAEKSLLPALTVQTWISPAILGTERRRIILEKKHSLSLFLDESNQLVVLYYGSKWVEVYSGYKLPAGEFTHIALTYDGKGTTRIYINGELQAESFDFTGTLSADGDFYVGCSPLHNKWTFGGLIDELKIFNHVVNVPKITEVRYEYDQYANPTRIYSHGDIANPEDDFVTHIDYQYDTERHILDLPSYTEVREVDPYINYNYTIKAANWYEYDDQGNLTKLARWEGERKANGTPNEYSQKNPVTAFEYDTRGNLIKLIDPLKRETLFSYDGFFPFPTAVRNALGQSLTIDYYGLGKMEQDYDRYLGLFGQVKRITDANGVSMRYVYDRYGRLRAVYGPNDGDIEDEYLYPSLLYTYSLEPISSTNDAGSDQTDTPLPTPSPPRHLKMYISARTEPLKSKYTYSADFDWYLETYGKTSLNFSSNFLQDYFLQNYLEASKFPNNGLSNVSSSVVYFDGFGRPLQTIQEAEPENAVVLSDITALDELGRVKEIFKPYALLDKSLYDSTYFASANLSPGNIYQEPNLDQPKFSVEYDPIGRIAGITDPDGARTTFKYDRWQVTAADPNGHETVYHYDAYGQLVKVEEIMPEDSVTTAYEYDILGNLVKIKYAGGNEVHFEYDALGRKKKMIDPDMGRGQSKYIFTPEGKAVELPSKPWEYSYDLAGNLVEIRDAKGQRIGFEYDALDRLVAKRHYELRPWKSEDLEALFKGAGRIHNLVSATSLWHATSYRTHNFETSYAFNHEETHLYTGDEAVSGELVFGPIDLTDVVTPSLSITYYWDTPIPWEVPQTKGRQIDTMSISASADGKSWRKLLGDDDLILHHPARQWETIQGISLAEHSGGKVWIKFSIENPTLPEFSTHEYEGWYINEVRVDGQRKADVQTPARWQYDDTAIGGPYAVGRLVQMTDPSGSTQYRYDNEGRVTEVKKTIDGATYTVVADHDALGRLKSLTYPDNEIVEYIYGRDGRVKQVKNRAGLYYAKQLLYDAVGNLREMTFGNNLATRYDYDDEGHQRLERITTVGWPSFGDYLNVLTSEFTIQDLRYSEYDPKGNIISSGATLTQPIVIRNLQRNGNFEEGFQANHLGNSWNSFDNGSADFGFHIDDWPLVVVEGKHTQLMAIKNAQKPDRYLGIYQTANVIPGKAYTFSMRGLVRTNTGDVKQTSYGYRLQVGFDLDGGQDWEAVKNWVELPWDEQLRVQDSFHFDAYTSTLIAKGDRLTVFIRAWKKWADAGEGNYDVDDVQLVGPASLTPTAPGTLSPDGAFETISEEWTYEYDALDRLLTMTGNPISREYGYDPLGNMKRIAGVQEYEDPELGAKQINIAITQEYEQTEQAGPHAVTALSGIVPRPGGASWSTLLPLASITVKYDANGNIERIADAFGPEIEYYYDYENRLVRINDEASFVYDGYGVRVKKTEGQNITLYPFPFFEIDNGQVVKYYQVGSMTVARRDPRNQPPNDLLFYHPDHLGSLNLLTNTQGQLVARIDYDPYGNTVVQGGSNLLGRYRFTGKELDASGLYYFGARYYDPRIAKFITPDPLRVHIPAQSMGGSQNLNPYAYVLNNPVNWVDPFGLQEGDIKWGPEDFNDPVYVPGVGWAEHISCSSCEKSRDVRDLERGPIGTPSVSGWQERRPIAPSLSHDYYVASISSQAILGPGVTSGLSLVITKGGQIGLYSFASPFPSINTLGLPSLGASFTVGIGNRLREDLHRYEGVFHSFTVGGGPPGVQVTSQLQFSGDPRSPESVVETESGIGLGVPLLPVSASYARTEYILLVGLYREHPHFLSFDQFESVHKYVPFLIIPRESNRERRR
jgi:RHS repeat-associated protein